MRISRCAEPISVCAGVCLFVALAACSSSSSPADTGGTSSPGPGPGAGSSNDAGASSSVPGPDGSSGSQKICNADAGGNNGSAGGCDQLPAPGIWQNVTPPGTSSKPAVNGTLGAAIIVDPCDPTRVWLGTRSENDEIWRSDSCGANWTRVNIDRDAGCFEAHVDPVCQRGGTTGWYWDETNTTSPNFHEHLAWVKQITQGIGLPMTWWQVPFGVPSNTPGGTPRHYRDNRVHYFFTHVSEFIEAGGVGALFGTGAANQTDIPTDGDAFKTAVARYFATPSKLP
jgi:hypothetical protein